MGIREEHPSPCRTGLLADERAHVGHSAGRCRVERRCLDSDFLSDPDPGQILGRNTDFRPHGGQVGDREHLAVFLDRFTQGNVLFHNHSVEGGTQHIAVEAAIGIYTGTDGGELLLNVGDGNFGLAQHLSRLQVVLLGGDLLLPQFPLPLVGRPGKAQTLLRCHQLAALFRERGACQHGQHLPLLDDLPQVGRHTLNHPGDPGNDVCRTILIEADLTGKLQRRLNPG